MGAQHNTHIANNTESEIKAVLTDTDKRNTTSIIEPKKRVCIPTPHGRNTVTAFRKQPDGTYPREAEATYTDDSDYSFIVKDVGKQLVIVRSVYGHIWQEATGKR